MFSLPAYLARIGFQEDPRADIATLARIQLCHSCSIPFEHLDVIAGKGVSLNEEDIFDKLVFRKRGGYCFEQNGLLLMALNAIGFQVVPLAARVRLDTPRAVLPRRTHVFVKVTLPEGEFLVDSGFGAFSLTAPLRFELDVAQETPHETRRIIHEEGRYFHQAWLKGTWTDLAEFGGEEMPLIDREVANWYTSTHPETRFKTQLGVGLAVRDGTRKAILNDRFLTRRGGEVLTETRIKDTEQLRDVLARDFGLVVPVEHSFGAWPFAS